MFQNGKRKEIVPKQGYLLPFLCQYYGTGCLKNNLLGNILIQSVSVIIFLVIF